ncbi:MAG: T9SS type A sorting domain-containing protein [Deferribacteres bacterium]|nr:T9SS type A sorting domain-containing protein [Deferribacteres bacterium]
MKKMCFILTFCAFLAVELTSAMAAGNGKAWIRQIGGTGFDQGNGITIAQDGAVIVVGSFSGTAEIDASLTLVSAGKKDIFIAKYDSSGNFMWAKQVGGAENDRALKSAIDAEGNIIITGSIGADMVTIGKQSLYSWGYTDILIAKFKSDGTPVWARNFGGSGVDEGTAVSVDSDGNYIVTGWFRNRVKFDETAFRSAGEYDAFILKLDPDGNLQWVNAGGGPLHDYGYALATDDIGNSYVTGRFHDRVIFNQATLTSAGETDIFVAKYAADGDLTWIKRFGGRNRDEAFGIAYDRVADQIVVTGSYSGELQFDENGQRFQTVAPMDFDMLLLCLNTDGNLKWARSEPGDDFGQGEAIAVDHLGGIYVSGIFGENLHFGPNVLLSRGNLDGFIIKYSADGEPEWIAHAGGGSQEDSAFVAIPGANGKDMYVTGSFQNISKFRDQTLASAGNDDAFVMRLPEPNETATLFPQVEGSQYVGREYQVAIKVGENRNVHQIDFDLLFTEYDFVSIKQPLAKAILPGPYLGENGSIQAQLIPGQGVLRITAHRGDALETNAADSVIAYLTFVSSLETEFGLRNLFSLKNIAAQNDVGEQIAVTPGLASVTHVGLPVWPGDTNNDGVVNEADVLPIGQFFASSGPGRREKDSSLVWSSQLAAPWERIYSTYADCDGGGTVDNDDILVIAFHWKRETSVPETTETTMGKARSASSSGTPTIYIKTNDENVQPGQVWIEVMADSVSDLFGLAYDLTYPVNSQVSVKKIERGTLIPDPIFFANNDTTQGRIAVAVAQKGQIGGVSGQGAVTRVLFDIGSYSLESFMNELGIDDLKAYDSRGRSIQFEVGTNIVVTDIAKLQSPEMPSDVVLYPNSPNPFNPTTTIRYSLPDQSIVSLKIYDQLGKVVRTLVDQQQQAGLHSILWDGRDSYGRQVASGIYLYLLKTERYMQARRMMLVK